MRVGTLIFSTETPAPGRMGDIARNFIYFSIDCLFMAFAHFWIYILSIFLLIYKSSLYVNYINFVTYDLNICLVCHLLFSCICWFLDILNNFEVISIYFKSLILMLHFKILSRLLIWKTFLSLMVMILFFNIRLFNLLKIRLGVWFETKI